MVYADDMVIIGRSLAEAFQLLEEASNKWD